MDIEVNSTRLYYNFVGDGDASRTVIFLHGFPFDNTTWDEQAAEFAAAYKVLRYDMRGLGRSEVGDGQYTIDTYADDLDQLMERLGIRSAVICGLSMGGYVALRAMQKYQYRFEGLILCDTKAEADSNEIKIKRAETVTRLKENGISALSETVENLFSPKTKEGHPEKIASIKKMVENMDPKGCIGATIAMAARMDATDVLQQIKVPVLLLVGEDDMLTTPDVMYEMKKQIANVEMHVIPDAGHLSNIENPFVFNNHLSKFLQEKVS